MILVDTNVLGRMTDSKDPQCAASRRSARVLAANGEKLVIFPQILYEFWSAATRKPNPPSNGLGMTCNQTNLWLNYFQRRFALLTDSVNLAPTWQALVASLGIRGIKSHVARLVAAMQCHGVSHLLTFNANHFKGLPVIIIDPSSV